MQVTDEDVIHEREQPERRSFLARVAATALGGVAAVFPFAVGSGVVLDPLRRKRRGPSDDATAMAGFVRICSLDALPADGRPQPFMVTADVSDAWTRATGQRVGAVFLSRADADGNSKVTAFSATCPHLGCAVEFDASQDQFACPCHVSGFGKDGQKLFGPSLRGLDPLEVKLVGEGAGTEVWVAFQQFRAGMAERVPVG